MTSSLPEDHGQIDFFGVSDGEATRESKTAGLRTHTTLVTARNELDSSMDRSQLSWLPDPFTWTDEDCVAMLDGFLIDQLQLLGDSRAGSELHAEILAWVAQPKRTLATLKEAPFSFQACCAAAGVDFEEMRECILRMFAPDLLIRLD
jgi:hypothetical protein